MKLDCPECGAEIPPADININLALAKCGQCGHVIDVMAAVEAGRVVPEDVPPVGGADTAGASGPGTLPVQPRPKVGRPKKFDVADDGRTLTVTWRWFTPAALFLLPFTLVWNGIVLAILIGGGTMAGLGMANAPDDVPGIAIGMFSLLFGCMPLLFVGIGIGMFYFAIALLMNRTTVTVDGAEFAQRHGPLPWPGNRVVAGPALRQFYVKKQTHHNKNHHTWHTYDLWAEIEGQGPLRLVGGFEQPEDAVFLEQLFEDRLKIADQPAIGELHR